jgi:RsiW-degrading membrane proteinase PrsW (M82 family)
MADLKDPKIIIFSLLAGVVPAVIWLIFWLREDKERPEPRGLVFLTFVLGMISVVFVLPLEKIAKNSITDTTLLIIVLASLEELIKYGATWLIALKSAFVNEPIDFPMYFITAALGFAALENALFLIHPLAIDQTVVGLLTGSLRYLGATLLHAISSGIIGIAMGLAFFSSRFTKAVYVFFGLITAIALHSTFNFFIMENAGENYLTIFGFLWVVTVIVFLLLEKLRRMSQITS